MDKEKEIDMGNMVFWISEAESYHGKGFLKVQQSGGVIFLLHKELREALKIYFNEELSSEIVKFEQSLINKLNKDNFDGRITKKFVCLSMIKAIVKDKEKRENK